MIPMEEDKDFLRQDSDYRTPQRRARRWPREAAHGGVESRDDEAAGVLDNLHVAIFLKQCCNTLQK